MRSLLFAFTGIFIFLTTPSVLCQNKRVAVIGSSSATGYGLANPAEESWVNRMKNYLLNQGIISSPSDVVNLAETGTNCVTGMPTGYVSPYGGEFQYPNPAKNITAAINLNPKPSIIIVSYPSNGYDWMPVDDILFHLKTIRQTAVAAGIRCYVTTTQPRNSFSVGERAKLKKLRDSIMAIFGPFALDFWTPLALADNSQNPNYALDNVHPNAAGHQLLFSVVITAITPSMSIVTATLPSPDIKLEVNTALNKFMLQWTVFSERNNSFYDVEKSLNGQSFTQIGKLNGKAVTSVPNTYNFLDDPKDNEKIYYRIQQTAPDGKKSYSNIVSIRRQNEDFQIEGIFPRLVKDKFALTITARHSTTVTVSVSDSQDKVIKHQTYQLQKGKNVIDYSFFTSGHGIYFVHVNNSNLHKIEKILQGE
jgi:lysophospholipase L1-like esterase